MLDCEPPVMVVACEALSVKADYLSFSTLRSLLHDLDWCKRRLAVKGLGKHALFENSADDVLKCLNDKSPYVVREAMRVLANHRVTRAHDRIIALVQSQDETTREVAVSCLEFVYCEDDFDLLLKLLSDKNKKVRNLLPTIILNVSNKKNWTRAYSLMKSSEGAKTRFAACQLLSKFGSALDKTDVNIFLHDSDGHIRNYASKIKIGSTPK